MELRTYTRQRKCKEESNQLKEHGYKDLSGTNVSEIHNTLTALEQSTSGHQICTTTIVKDVINLRESEEECVEHDCNRERTEEIILNMAPFEINTNNSKMRSSIETPRRSESPELSVNGFTLTIRADVHHALDWSPTKSNNAVDENLERLQRKRSATLEPKECSPRKRCTDSGYDSMQERSFKYTCSEDIWLTESSDWESDWESDCEIGADDREQNKNP